jgi:hypothetical protein
MVMSLNLSLRILLQWALQMPKIPIIASKDFLKYLLKYGVRVSFIKLVKRYFSSYSLLDHFLARFAVTLLCRLISCLQASNDSTCKACTG